ncbi:hypothetical protein DL98DRAFT_317382 [Cadophora sp. DSE1049]|nr:hypothetical protein DL98DRAFT_317382 [Cadophora sp. DSE1049]
MLSLPSSSLLREDRICLVLNCCFVTFCPVSLTWNYAVSPFHSLNRKSDLFYFNSLLCYISSHFLFQPTVSLHLIPSLPSVISFSVHAVSYELKERLFNRIPELLPFVTLGSHLICVLLALS